MDHETFMRIMPIPEGSPMWRKMQMKLEEQLEQGKAKLEEEKRQIIEQAKAEGIAEAKAEGKAEAIKAVAKRMLESGIEMDQVAKFTGLSLARIKELQNSPA